VATNATPDGLGQVSDIVQSVKEYALQETVGPLKNAGRWIGFGAAGALMFGAASAFLVLGVLRLLQTEFAPTFSGRWMQLVPYAVALLVAIALGALAVSRISKQPLHKEQH
jgi:ascorbate-specific PTS system EIIC-type component UlaA